MKKKRKKRIARITFFGGEWRGVNDTVFRNTNLFPPLYRSDVLWCAAAVIV